MNFTASSFRLCGVLVLIAACRGGNEAPVCPELATDALRTCVVEVGHGLADCHAQGGTDCAPDRAALDALEAAVADSCGAGEFGALDRDAVAGRLRNACVSEAQKTAWRFYGGPQDAVFAEASDADRTCLVDGHRAAVDLVDASLGALQDCLIEDCGASKLEGTRADLVADTAAAIAGSCPALQELTALSPQTAAARTDHQADCLLAAGRPDAGLDLDCGPSHALFDAPRGEWTQVVLDAEEWGTLCGDGTDYAFWVRPAPEGQPLDRVFVGLEGGGVCLFESDCTSRLDSAPELFTAQDDLPEGTGIASLDPSVSPFADWTQVFLPYCNQDVFAGGGTVEDLGELQLPRYGAVNLRVSLGLVRDMIWREMDAEGGAGYRPDELNAVFGGWSAGAYGTLYNFHYLLDELLWPRSIAFPDAGLALHNDSVLGVGSLGAVKIPAWGLLEYLPPYCFDDQCAVGPTMLRAISPRLKQVPEQQMLLLTNPKDDIQAADAFFEDDVSWINALRRDFCETRDLPGVQYYITSVSTESVHVVSLREELWLGEVDGVVMADWFRRAVEEPETVTDRAEEADFVDQIPGVEPYPCAVAP